MSDKIWNQNLDQYCRTSRMLRRALLDEGVQCGWPCKWGMRWSICYPDKRMVDSGLTRLSDWTLRQWVEFANKHA